MAGNMNKENNKTFDFSISSEGIMPCLQIGKLLTSTLNLTEILNLIMSRMSQLVEAENWSLLLLDETTNELTFEVVVGLEKESVKDFRIPVGTGIAGQAAATGEIIFSPDVRKDPRFYQKVDTRTGFVTKSLLGIPLKTHGRVLGVIEIINIDNFDLFKLKKLPILSIMSDYAAIAIENSQYMAKIRKLSITDEYTGLYNARYLHDILPALLHEADRHQKNLAVAFMDIDNFKHVVDTYGHLSGSMVLKEIGETVTSCLSEKDILIKYGGDEYVLVMPDRDKSSAADLVEKILNAIRSSTYLLNDTQPVKVTASFGLAVYPEHALSKKDLLLLADNSMYKIKKSTKNGIGIS